MACNTCKLLQFILFRFDQLRYFLLNWHRLSKIIERFVIIIENDGMIGAHPITHLPLLSLCVVVGQEDSFLYKVAN